MPNVFGGQLTYKGTLQGQAQFRPDLGIGELPNGATYHAGGHELHLKDGSDLEFDTWLVFKGDPSRMAGIYNVASGTGAYEGASGQLTVSGTYDTTATTNTFSYEGQICVPN
jgi:hypothetical protein